MWPLTAKILLEGRPLTKLRFKILIMIKIVIAEDSSDYTNVLSSILGEIGKIELIATVENGKELLDFLKHTEVDIVLMDIRMPVMDGLTAAFEVKKHFRGVKVLILSSHNKEAYIKKAMQVGAEGYVLKHEKEEVLLGIDYLHRNKTYFSQEITRTLAKGAQLNALNKQIKLSPREREVLELLGNGFSSNKIGATLSIGTSTVNTYRANLLEKFKAINVSELMKKAALGGYLN